MSKINLITVWFSWITPGLAFITNRKESAARACSAFRAPIMQALDLKGKQIWFNICVVIFNIITGKKTQKLSTFHSLWKLKNSYIKLVNYHMHPVSASDR